MYYIGVDPDLHHTGVALLDENKVLFVRCISIFQKYKGSEASLQMSLALCRPWFDRMINNAYVVVEGQELYLGGGTKNPRNILHLSQVAGACIVTAQNQALAIDGNYFPVPSKWKGQVPKQIHQARILQKLDWGYKKIGAVLDGYCYPIDEDGLAKDGMPKTHWKHVVDAIGLAQWGKEQYEKELAKA